MYQVKLEHVSFRGGIFNHKRQIIFESLNNFSAQFSFGKSYLLYAPPSMGAWAISWMLGGAIEPQSGSITLDGKPYPLDLRKQDGWLVRFSEIKKFGIWEQSVQAQVRHGLKTTKTQYAASEEALIREFRLSPSRYVRRLHQLGNEEWSASCAIGLANGKRIFSFPHVGFLRPTLFEEYGKSWLKEHFNTLRSSGALLVVPTNVLAGTEGFFDEVIDVTRIAY